MSWLLDTNVLSELRRPRPDRNVVKFVAAQPLDALFLSSITLMEIRFAIETVEDAARRVEMNDWLTHKLRPMFEGRILEVSEDIMLKWRLLLHGGRKRNHTFSPSHLILSATALHYGLTIVSRQTSEFEEAGAPVFNPWTSPPSS